MNRAQMHISMDNICLSAVIIQKEGIQYDHFIYCHLLISNNVLSHYPFYVLVGYLGLLMYQHVVAYQFFIVDGVSLTLQVKFYVCNCCCVGIKCSLCLFKKLYFYIGYYTHIFISAVLSTKYLLILVNFVCGHESVIASFSSLCEPN